MKTRTQHVRPRRTFPPLADKESAVRALGEVINYAIEFICDLPVLQLQWPDDSEKLETFVDKIAAEAALLVHLARRLHPDENLRQRIDALALELTPHARTERNAAMVMRFPHSAATLGFAHVALQSVGYVDADYDSIVRGAFLTGEVDAVERVPFRSIELLWLHEQMGMETKHGHEELLPLSILSTLPNPCFSLREQAYQLTHALMYATDFGRRPDRLRHRNRDLSRSIDAFLAWTCVTEDFDLTCELLIGVECARLQWSAPSQVAAIQAWQHWTSVGYLPGLNYRSDEHDSLAEGPARAYAFRHVYHTTFVFGMLCAMLAASKATGESATHDRIRWLPADRWTHRIDGSALTSSVEGVVARAHCFLESRQFSASPSTPVVTRDDPTKSEPQELQPLVLRCSCPIGEGELPTSPKLRVLRLPSSVERAVAATPVCGDCTTAFLFDCALILSVRSYDLIRTAWLLAEFTKADIAPSAGMTEVVAFLAGQQLPSGALGAYFLPHDNLQTDSAAKTTELLAMVLEVCAHHLRRKLVKV
jgi:hypothetical protein